MATLPSSPGSDVPGSARSLLELGLPTPSTMASRMPILGMGRRPTGWPITVSGTVDAVWRARGGRP